MTPDQTVPDVVERRIREALRQADDDGRLEQLATRIGIGGGVTSLRSILHEPEMAPMDRGMLSLYLFGEIPSP